MKRLLYLALWSMLALGLSAFAPAALATAPKPAVIKLGDLPLLFADDSGLVSTHSLTRTMHPCRRRASPVLEPEQSWEGQRVYIYGSVYHDDAANLFRMWYQSAAMMLYATSRDGLVWDKPALGIRDYHASRENNGIYTISSPSVLRDAFEKDPAKRYKILGSKGGGYHAAYSADGLHWKPYPRNPVLTSSDTITLAQDPATGEYLAYHKRMTLIRGFRRRVVWLSRSHDFQTWTRPELVFAPDAVDDAWVSRPVERTEIYNMSVYPHAAGYIALPTVFHVTAERPRAEVQPEQSPVDGPIDVQLATSADGSHWSRSEPRRSMIPRGPAGSFDAGAILGVSSTLVHTADESWVYYTALTTTHGAPMPPKRLSIGRAEWRLHGFVSLDCGEKEGRLATRPLKLSAPALLVNADATGGELRVALLEADGQPIHGLALADCEPLRQDATRWTARWRGVKIPPLDRPVRVLIQMRHGRLFSISAASPAH